jgi:hypothetical protein
MYLCMYVCMYVFLRMSVDFIVIVIQKLNGEFLQNFGHKVLH